MRAGSIEHPSGWKACRDEKHGFTLWHPPDWKATGPPGRCVQLQRGEPSFPDGTPEVDIFIRVVPLEGNFPADYLRPGVEPAEQLLEVGRGVAYSA